MNEKERDEHWEKLETHKKERQDKFEKKIEQ